MKTTSKKQAVRNILIFTLLVNALAWLGPLLGGDPQTPGPGFLLWGVAPLLAALIMKYVLRDDVTLGLRPNLRGNGRWYALSLLIYPVAIAIVLALGLLLGAARINPFSGPEFIAALLPALVTFFIFALFEEVGWRGYLAPRVYGLNDRLSGHALVGLIWASWHLPYMSQLWAHTSEGLLTLLPRFLLGTMVSAVVYGEIRLRTGTFWPAVLMHWVGNALANSLLAGFAGAGVVTLVTGQEWLGSFGVEGVLMIGLFGLVGGMLYRARRAAQTEAAIREQRPFPST